MSFYSERKTSKSRCWCGGDVIDSIHPDYYRCLRCNTFVSKRSQTSDSLKSFYSFGGYWHDYVSSLKYPNIEERDKIILGVRSPQWFNILKKIKPKFDTLLEIGCSEGSFLYFCKEHGVHQVVGIEVDPLTCDFAKQKFKLEHVIPGIFPDVALPFNKYDVVAGFDVVEHFTDPLDALKAVNDYLADDGVFIFQTPCYNNNTGNWMQFKPLEHLFLFDRNNIRLLFDQAGLEIINSNSGLIAEDIILIGRKKLNVPQSSVGSMFLKRQRIAVGLVEHMGDIIACEPVARYVREKHPDAEITWITENAYQDLTIYHPSLDNTLPVKCLGDWIHLKEAGSFDEYIDLHVNRRRCTKTGKILEKQYGELNVDVDKYYNYGSLLSSFSLGAGLPPLDQQPRMYIPLSVEQTINALHIPMPYIVIHCTSNEEARDWKKEKWVELVRYLINIQKYTVVEIGTIPVCESLSLKFPLAYRNFCNQCSILESAEVIKRADIFIGVDSGPAHIGNAVGTYGIILLGKYRIFDSYMPFTGTYADGTNATIIRSKGKPASMISVNEVKNAVHNVLSGREYVAAPSQNDDVRLIAFYLPQYHPIPENDQWWGKGFTEWTNAVKAKPLFPGHYQPHLPADLGFYDLRLPEARKAQAELARRYGIHGFCYYHYWFKGKLLLDYPLQQVLASGEPDFPFCLCWANENWTRAWDGRQGEVLIKQDYSEEDDRSHIQWLLRVFQDRRYIRIDNKPLMMIYLSGSLPNAQNTIDIWREEARKVGEALYLCKVESATWEYGAPCLKGFDACVEFQPDWGNLGLAKKRLQNGHVVYDYSVVVERMLNKPTPPYKRFPCVTPMWDNSARRKQSALVIDNSTPDKYEEWLSSTIMKLDDYKLDDDIIFINAWNEWGEGNHLEPDQRNGLAYLEATKRALSGSSRNGRVSGKKVVSIIIPVFNRIEYIKRCMESIERYTPERYEIIFVDNGSADTNSYLQSLEKDMRDIYVVLNGGGQSFAAGVNQALQKADGEYILILKEDAVVTEGWLARLISAINQSPEIGMAGPMSNIASGPQYVSETSYGEDINAMHGFAKDFSARNSRETSPGTDLSDLCLLIRKDLKDVIGGLDENYVSPRLAVDDLCLRSIVAGYKNIIVQDVFIHGDIPVKGDAVDVLTSSKYNSQYFADKWKDIAESNGDGYKVHLTKELQRTKLIEWGEYRLSIGDNRGAVKIFERITGLVKDDYKALNNLGVIQWQLGEAVSAIKSFQAALAINPKFPDALSNIMKAAKESGKVDMIKPILQGILDQLQLNN